MPVFVTKSFLPPLKEYEQYVEKIYTAGLLTNQGPLLVELEDKLKCFLGVEHFQYVTNGTIALQMALAALDINDGEIITTPFSYVATTSSILWQRCRPVFVDIEKNNFTIDAAKIEAAITSDTRAIMAVHVFGYACDTEAIQEIADKYHLKVIYDGAHAFASKYKGKSLLDYGDISTLSFHATKLFHTIEGGACIVRDDAVNEKLSLIKKFGHYGDEHFILGINGKQSEFHAAMGLSNFPYINQVIQKRKEISDAYDYRLSEFLIRPITQNSLEYNYAYYPVVFSSEIQLLKVLDALAKEDIYARRYFYPSLNMLPYVDYQKCPTSEDIARRIVCLPLYPDLDLQTVAKICDIILNEIRK